jgi:hypothetical protein
VTYAGKFGGQTQTTSNPNLLAHNDVQTPFNLYDPNEDVLYDIGKLSDLRKAQLAPKPVNSALKEVTIWGHPKTNSIVYNIFGPTSAYGHNLYTTKETDAVLTPLLYGTGLLLTGGTGLAYELGAGVTYLGRSIITSPYLISALQAAAGVGEGLVKSTSFFGPDPEYGT